MIPVIDLFAGPGGLNEGFSSVTDDDGQPVFKTVASFEMDEHACATLRLRTAMRAIQRKSEGFPEKYYRFLRDEITWETLIADPDIAAALAQAKAEVHQVELGPDTRSDSDDKIEKALERFRGQDWVLIGGPPCQAYSLAGRSRRTNDVDFEKDKKHFLFKEYLHIIERFEPTIFVMENVKGLLSSTHGGNRMFDMIIDDLSKPKPGLEYEIRSLVVDREYPGAQEFVIRSENYGIPQRRHRVILLGVKKESPAQKRRAILSEAASQVTVRDALQDLPRVESRISPLSKHSREKWGALLGEAIELGTRWVEQNRPAVAQALRTSDAHAVTLYREWVGDTNVSRPVQHQARKHMDSDLRRYAFLAYVSERVGRVPKLGELEGALQPKHRNVGRPDTPFTDRFRVQMWDAPSTTVVSHISKDGHYYIHPDADQMRSLTVREAARLQTFPDNYYFRGGATQQYHQVGNAVPPMLAFQIGSIVAYLLGRGTLPTK